VSNGLMRFSGKTAIVTGGGSGIGRATALDFAAEGAKVGVLDLSEGAAQETVRLAQAAGGEARAYQVDVSRSAEVERTADATLADFSTIDILVTSAGVASIHHAFDVTDEEWSRVIGINLTGSWNACRHFGPYLAQAEGRIVNVASLGSLFAAYYRVPYMASKGGVMMLTKALALDLAEQRVRVNAVAPGPVDTPMVQSNQARWGGVTRDMAAALTPMRRMARAEEVASAIKFLASDEAGFITGQLLIVDGGFSAGSQIGGSWKPVEGSEPLAWLH
jgi:NAD(P)-dependent dehydrogenase (short-subunit alcohol dehydrogenase family)